MDNEKKCGCNEEENTCGCGHDHGHSDECGCGEDHHEHFVVDLEDDNGKGISCPIIDACEFEENG